LDTTISANIEKLKRKINDELDHLSKEATKTALTAENPIQEGEGDLTERERVILEYIEKKPGKTKQAVVDHFSGKYSRVSVFRCIENLEKFGMILVKSEHSQKHSLYINSKSLLISEFHNLDQFKERFLHLLKVTRKKYDALNAKKQSTGIENDPQLVKLIDDYEWHIILLLYYTLRHLITTYGTVALFRWPLLTSDREVLNRLYKTVFTKLREIMLASLKFVPSEKSPQVIFEHIMTEGYGDFYSLYAASKEYELEKEFNPVMDCILKIRKDVLPPISRDPDGTRRTANSWMELLTEQKSEKGTIDR
jgi:hypothetical protein